MGLFIFFGIIILCLVFAFIFVPIAMLGNQKILNQMRMLVDEYNRKNVRIEELKEVRADYKKKLIALKSKLNIVDKKALMEAGDLLNSI